MFLLIYNKITNTNVEQKLEPKKYIKNHPEC